MCLAKAVFSSVSDSVLCKPRLSFLEWEALFLEEACRPRCDKRLLVLQVMRAVLGAWSVREPTVPRHVFVDKMKRSSSPSPSSPVLRRGIAWRVQFRFWLQVRLLV